MCLETSFILSGWIGENPFRWGENWKYSAKRWDAIHNRGNRFFCCRNL